MLQQTQVATVAGYFRVDNGLPTVGGGIASPEEQVLRLWEGLGGTIVVPDNCHAAARLSSRAITAAAFRLQPDQAPAVAGHRTLHGRRDFVDAYERRSADSSKPTRFRLC